MPRDDEPALEPLPDLAGVRGRRGCVVTSPAPRARVAGADVEPRLGPWRLGGWAGRGLAELPGADLEAWRGDPDWSGHGGESLREVQARVHGLLHDWHGRDGRLVAVTHASVVRAAVTLALRAPVGSAWDVDVLPGSVTELHPTSSGWRLVRFGCAA